MAAAPVLMGWPALPPLAEWMQLSTHFSWEGDGTPEACGCLD